MIIYCSYINKEEVVWSQHTQTFDDRELSRQGLLHSLALHKHRALLQNLYAYFIGFDSTLKIQPLPDLLHTL